MSDARTPVVARRFDQSGRSVMVAVLSVVLAVLLVVLVPAPRRARAVSGAMFVVRVDEDVIHGNGWTIGSTLHITIVRHGSVPSSPYERSVPMGVAPSFEVDIGSQFDIQPPTG